MKKLSASILSSDFGRLAEQVDLIVHQFTVTPAACRASATATLAFSP